MKLSYFLVGLGWTSFRPDLIGTETWDDQNTANGDDKDACRKVVIVWYIYKNNQK